MSDGYRVVVIDVFDDEHGADDDVGDDIEIDEEVEVDDERMPHEPLNTMHSDVPSSPSRHTISSDLK